MAEISTTVSIVDKISKPIRDITNETDKLISKLRTADTTSEEAFSGIRASEFVESMRSANTEAGTLTGAFGTMASKVTGMLSTVGLLTMAWQGLKSVVSGVNELMQESLDAYNTQLNSELMLEATLSNTVGKNTELVADIIKQKASEIQSRGMIGDESMIMAGAEFSRYMTDSKAISLMMDTLSNYAVGMSGGKEITVEQLTSYAESLGKALNGTFTFLERQNFQISDLQKQIIESGDDMTKALVISDIVNNSWDNLYEKISNTPQNKVVQLNNALGDMKEVIGESLTPAVESLTDFAIDRLPTINGMVATLSEGISFYAQGFGVIIDKISGFIESEGFTPIMSLLGTPAQILGIQLDTFTAISEVQSFKSQIEEENARLEEYENFKANFHANKSAWYNDYYSSKYTPDTEGFNATLEALRSTDSTVKSIDNTLKTTAEDLKYMRELADETAINRYTTASITVDVGGITANGSSEADIDGIIERIVSATSEAVQTTVEGAY